jgi:DNA-binding MarR family transcriptional regulator
MALKGNLRDFSTTQLLNLINLAKKTGTLVIEGPGQGAQMAFRNGKLIYAHMGQEDGNLASILRKAGKLTDEQVKVLRARAATASDKELGLLLINAGYVNQGDILASLRSHILEIVYRLFTWVEGMFRFEPTLMPGDDKITVPIDLENVIMEGARRMREWEQLSEELPNLDMALKFTDRPNANIRNMNLSVEEWRVVSYINPKNSMKAIAKANKLSDLEIRRIVYGLLQAGLVEVIRPEGAPRPVPPGLMPSGRKAVASAPTNKTAQLNVVNKLIARIRSL